MSNNCFANELQLLLENLLTDLLYKFLWQITQMKQGPFFIKLLNLLTLFKFLKLPTFSSTTFPSC